MTLESLIEIVKIMGWPTNLETIPREHLDALRKFYAEHNPEKAYKTAKSINDDNLLREARQALINSDPNAAFSIGMNYDNPKKKDLELLAMLGESLIDSEDEKEQSISYRAILESKNLALNEKLAIKLEKNPRDGFSLAWLSGNNKLLNRIGWALFNRKTKTIFGILFEGYNPRLTDWYQKFEDYISAYKIGVKTEDELLRRRALNNIFHSDISDKNKILYDAAVEMNDKEILELLVEPHMYDHVLKRFENGRANPELELGFFKTTTELYFNSYGADFYVYKAALIINDKEFTQKVRLSYAQKDPEWAYRNGERLKDTELMDAAINNMLKTDPGKCLQFLTAENDYERIMKLHETFLEIDPCLIYEYTSDRWSPEIHGKARDKIAELNPEKAFKAGKKFNDPTLMEKALAHVNCDITVDMIKKMYSGGHE